MWMHDFDSAISGIIRDTMPIIEGLFPNPAQCNSVKLQIKRILYGHMDELRENLVDKWGFPDQEQSDG